MSDTKFTPGPWRIICDSKFCMKDIFITSKKRENESKVPICELDIYFDEPMFTEANANANLIAAAPNLYKALEEIVKEGQDFEKRTKTCISWLNGAKEVLEKARGESC